MYRISIEMPPGYWDRVDFLLNWADDFEDFGIALGANLKDADLRLVHHDIALQEWQEKAGRIDGPLIVYERTDQASIQTSRAVREMLAHPNVRLWLKRNTFHDLKHNNEPHLRGYWHYAKLLDYPSLGIGALPDIKNGLYLPDLPIDQKSYDKVRMLPVVPITRFDSLVNREDLPRAADRNIDVNFAGQVDYRGNDDVLALHRRAAALSIVNMRELKTFVGLNGSVRWDIYQDTLRHSKISVSPWGYGEYSYRDYESILSGCVMVKPDTGHVRTFPPDLYQAGKYYVACRPDFEDLHSVVREILDDFESYHTRALAARKDLLAANGRSVVVEYFLDLFDSIRFNETDPERIRARRIQDLNATLLQVRNGQTPVLDLRTAELGPVRCTVQELQGDALAIRGERPVRISEDQTANDTHDVRLAASSVADGQYELLLALRPQERKTACLIVHKEWKDQIRINFDADGLVAATIQVSGDTFKHGPIRCRKLFGDWSVMKVPLQIAHSPNEVAFSVGLVDSEKRAGYTDDGQSGIDLGLLSLYRSAR